METQEPIVVEDRRDPMDRAEELSAELFVAAMDKDDDTSVGMMALVIAAGRAAGVSGSELAEAVRAFCDSFADGALERAAATIEVEEPEVEVDIVGEGN